MGVVGLEWVTAMVTVQKRLKTTGLVRQQAMHNKDKNSHSGPYAGQPLREKVHIWLGSLHAVDFNHCLRDDSLYVRYQKILRVYVLEKVKTILYIYIYFFLVIHQQWLMKSTFV